MSKTRVEAAALVPQFAYGPDAPDPRDWLAAIIDGSDDAIVSKNLSGIIQSWNGGATRLFGYKPEEIIGQSVTVLIPPDRLDEEPIILAQIHAGKRVDHFETKRRRKDGSLVDISLTISPIRNEHGDIVGASKIARDITERLLAQQQQQLLMGEMQHRVKNLFALANAIVSLSARSNAEKSEVIASVQDRLSSLARAHELILGDRSSGSDGSHVTLITLIRAILEPYYDDDRIRISGDDCQVGGKAATNLALLLHEMATNAAKYGALSVERGRLHVEISADDAQVRLCWRENGGPVPLLARPPGFGSRLERGLASALNASIERDWQPTGLVASVAVSKAMLAI
ncbi:PAS domain S-box protein [Bosea sp. NBC_00550]|uniref:PAS domain S-box protein n=1 Tax=Bosea sp. NBC_00550 TaxID=2969621 RepID=UPI002230DE19|nr:PAS domain S-box protein [Bosea sp. NBC_00550]UZF95707.1 PAS domain S-box protein [Bosea sp. NBC_00550]